MSIRRACRALPVERSTYHYRSRRTGQAVLTKRIKEIAQTRRFQHRVQRLLDRPSHDPAQMLTHPIVVDPDHIAELGPSAILFHGGSLLNWLRRSSRNANLTRAGATAQICEKFFTSSPPWLVGALHRQSATVTF